MTPGAHEGLIAQILRLGRRMRRDSGRGPSAAELAGYLHLSLAQVRAALARAKARAAGVSADGGSAAGLEVPGGLSEALTAEEERAFCRRFGIDGRPGPLAAPPRGTAIQADLRALTDKVLASLAPRERKLLRKRFGLGVSTDATLEEVGQQFSVTRARIRRIEAKARCRPDRNRADRHTYAFRPVGADDLPLLCRWLRRPHVARWWPDPEKLIADLSRNLVDHQFDAHVLLLDDRPVGYLQCYDASPGAEEAVLGQPPGTRGLDLFIGEPWALGGGHGPAFVRRLTEQLLATPEIRRVIADPAPVNTRSMRCFEKAGFRRDAEIRRPWGPVVLMICDDTQVD